MTEERELPLDLDKAKEHIALMSDADVRQIVVQANQWADYQKFTGLMNSIAAQMREKENPDGYDLNKSKEDTNALIKVEFPKEGGVLTYMENYEHPYRGYPHHEFVEKIEIIKKINRAVLSGLYHEFSYAPKWKLVLLLPILVGAKYITRAWISVFHRMVDRFLIKPIRYSKAIRELHRAFSVSRPDELLRDADVRVKFRDILCMIAEFDNAYRFRLQDIVVEMDKEIMKKNPKQELLRLLSLSIEREKTQEIKDTWRLVNYFVKFYLTFDKDLLKTVQFALLEVNLKELELTIEDKEFCLPRKDYTFGFTLHPIESDITLMKLYEIRTKHTTALKRIRSESDEAHQKVAARHRQEPESENNKKEMIQLDNHFNELMKHEVDLYQKERELILK